MRNLQALMSGRKSVDLGAVDIERSIHHSTRYQHLTSNKLKVFVGAQLKQSAQLGHLVAREGHSQKNSTVQGMKCSSRWRYSTGAFEAMISCSRALAAMAVRSFGAVLAPAQPLLLLLRGCCCWAGAGAVCWRRYISWLQRRCRQRLPSHLLMVLVTFVWSEPCGTWALRCNQVLSASIGLAAADALEASLKIDCSQVRHPPARERNSPRKPCAPPCSTGP